MNEHDTRADISATGTGPLSVHLHREDDPTSAGQQVFVLRDEAGQEVARTDPFLADDAPARNTMERLLERLPALGWTVSQRPNAAFGDDWWEYRFSPGATASTTPAELLGAALASPVAPSMTMGRRKRGVRQRRVAAKLPSVAMAVLVLFIVFTVTLSVGFIVLVLFLVSR